VALDVEFQEPNMKKWDKFNAIKDAAFTEIEKLRKDKGINKNTEATVTIAFNNEFDFSTDTLAKYLNVAKVIIEQVTSTDIKVTCTNEHLVRCERCWNYYDASSLNEEHLCSRCCKVLKK
jgi:isoleucyl-tRNA synthetase